MPDDKKVKLVVDGSDFCLMITAEKYQRVQGQAEDLGLGEDEEDVKRAIFILQLHAVTMLMLAKSSTRPRFIDNYMKEFYKLVVRNNLVESQEKMVAK